jgi:hypothetical protein
MVDSSCVWVLKKFIVERKDIVIVDCGEAIPKESPNESSNDIEHSIKVRVIGHVSQTLVRLSQGKHLEAVQAVATASTFEASVQICGRKMHDMEKQLVVVKMCVCVCVCVVFCIFFCLLW